MIQRNEIFLSVFENHRFSSKLNYLFSENDIASEVNLILNEFNQKSLDNIMIIKQKIESTAIICKPCKNSTLVIKNFLDDFCCFCIKKKCRMFQFNFRYLSKNFEI